MSHNRTRDRLTDAAVITGALLVLPPVGALLGYLAGWCVVAACAGVGPWQRPRDE